MNDRDDLSDDIHDDELAENGINRRRFILGGGAGLAVTALSPSINPALAQSADNIKRVQPRAGYTVPLPKNWVADHVTDDVNPPLNEMPAPLTANVNEKNPLQYDLFLSMNSATGYLMLDRLLALSQGFNVQMNIRPILPREVLTGEEGEMPYTYTYNNVEFRRLAKFLGVPFEYPNPQVVVQDVWPPLIQSLDAPIGEKKQKNAYYISRMAVAAALQNKGEAFLDSVFRMIWDGTTRNWPDRVIPVLEKAGLDARAMDDDIRANPKRYDDVLANNASAQTATGHEGSAVTAFRQEPFPGQNRFDQLFWTLQRNGLTSKPGSAALPTSSWTG
jgi:2-hydroxychromene-2-carboxylate isomerase